MADRSGDHLMRAVVIEDFGPRSQAGLTDMPPPACGPGQVLVQVGASALNPLDAKIAIGAMEAWFPVRFPYVPGTDFAGIVLAVGEAVPDLRVGDPVFGRADPLAGGALAEVVAVASDRVTLRPPHVPTPEAACLPTPAGTALQALAPVSGCGDAMPLLVLGDGAVARAAAAIAGSRGRAVAEAARLGSLEGPHLVLDTVGGALQREAAARLPSGSHIVSIVSPVDAAVAAAGGLTAEFLVLQTGRRQLDDLARLASDGVLRPRIDHRAGLGRAADLFAGYVAREVAGKIVIEGVQQCMMG